VSSFRVQHLHISSAFYFLHFYYQFHVNRLHFKNGTKNHAIAPSEKKTYTLNFGPQHPATQGVMLLIMELDGAIIERIDPHMACYIGVQKS